MKYIMALFIIVVLSCKNDSKAKASLEIENTKEQNDELEIYDFAGLEKFLNIEDNKTHVVNFWATWCAPCVKEMPYFEKLNANYKDKNVEVLLVSLDFPFQYDKKLKPYIKEHKLQSKVVALDDPDMNSWMSKVDEEWSGGIPITIIYNKNKRQFYERSFTYKELEDELKQFLN
ncbi:MAG: redoxin family protein [Bacteroidetes bacterium]|nr:redoxin family protein [Bacteroidota bacterium]